MGFPTYSITSDFSDGVHIGQLHDEVGALGIEGFGGITAQGDDCTLVFTGIPSQEDQDAVSAVVAAHSPLASLKEEKHEVFDAETQQYLCKEYSSERQRSLLDLRLEAVDLGYTNRKAYIDQFRAWLYAVVMYHKGTIEPQIAAATTRAELEAVTWDLSAFDAQKPSPRVEIHIAASMTD